MSLPNLGGILLAAAGLGFVIFVHELGHFAVARMCGVKCEKFMVGFDFWGLKFSRKWGETEYGIGVFPLGGYVKMLGQDDDPSKSMEQLEASQVAADSEFAKEITGPDGKTRIVDRRSYQAKSVPQRMAIISAGVIMNIIFAYVFAFIAFGIGVEYAPCVVSQTAPGAPAWQAGLEAGDEIVQIGDRERPGFEHLMAGVSLGDLENGVKFRVLRAATGEVEELILKPKRKEGDTAKIGVTSPLSNFIVNDKEGLQKLMERESLPPVAAGDEIIAINGEPISSYRDLASQLALNASEPIDVTVRRKATSSSEAEGDSTESEVTFSVPAQPARRLGLVMTMGPIFGIQQGSPAEAAGLKPGDKITAIDGQSIGAASSGEPGIDPLALPELLAESQTTVTLSVLRADAGENAEPESVQVTPRKVTWIETPVGPDSPMPLPALGIAYEVEPTVAAIVSGGPAESAGIQPGDKIRAVTITRPASGDEEARTGSKTVIGDGPGAYAWPSIHIAVQRLKEGSEVVLTLDRSGAEKEVEARISPDKSPDAFVVERQLTALLQPPLRMREVTSISDQAWHAWDRTQFSLTTVVRFVRKIFANQVPTNKLGGPLQILNMSYTVASHDLASFLLFLTLLSANLAVLNFLPIPVLDGGHMVFLAYEGITGKPANEKLMVGLQVVGMLLLLSLMIYVTRNDIMSMFFKQAL
ncbi:MAG: site-2 protease family protein [Planctomycetota bacterium]